MKEKWYKNFMYLLCFGFVVSLFIVGLFMMFAENNSRKKITEQLNPIYTITEKVEMFSSNSESNNQILFPQKKILSKIGKLDEVKYFDFSMPTYLEISNIKHIDLTEGKNVAPIFKFIGTEKANFFDLSTNKVSLTKGRTFKPEELTEGLNVLIVSKEFAQENKFDVGDTISINSILKSKSDSSKYTNYPFSFVLIGIYDLLVTPESKDLSKDYILRDRSNALNDFYTPNQTIKKMVLNQEKKLLKDFPEDYANLKDENGNKISGEQLISNISKEEYYEPLFLLKEDTDYKNFESHARKLLTNYPYYKLLNAKTKYDHLTREISFIPIVFKGVTIVSFIILIAMISSNTSSLYKQRKQKSGIFRTILLQNVIIFLLSMGFGLKIGEILPYELIYPNSRIDGVVHEAAADEVNHEGHNDEEGEESAISEHWDDYAYNRVDSKKITLREVTDEYRLSSLAVFIGSVFICFVIIHLLGFQIFIFIGKHLNKDGNNSLLL